MSEKYIDLRGKIAEAGTPGVGFTAIRKVLEWLDRHPHQVPGRTITASEFQELMEDVTTSYQVGFTDGLYRAGGRVVPDPEPTNAEKLAAQIRLISRELSPEGHDKNLEDESAKILAERLDAAGVRAPGGDDA